MTFWSTVVPQSENTPDPKRIFGIVGIISLSMGNYLVVIKSRKEVGQLDGRRIWKIGSAEVLPFFDPTNVSASSSQRSDDRNYLSLLKNVLALPLFFSYDMDITNSFQRRSAWSAQTVSKEPMYKRVDHRFWWNRYMQTALLQPVNGSHAPEKFSKFILPIMMGFIEIHHLTIRGTLVEFALFSRRHTRRAGMRYVVRGIDSSGSVANFIETEQVVLLPDRKLVHSFVQIRGSIPVYWTQLVTLKYAPTIAVQADKDIDSAFKKHFQDLMRIYGQNAPYVCTSLINLKGSELKLAQQYDAAVKRNALPGVEYYPFDFHKECPGTNFSGIQRLLHQIQPSLANIGWFIADNAQHFEGPDFRPGSVLRLQNGVVRTNCIDNLDRTNVSQSVFAKHVLMQQLLVLGVVTPEVKFDDLTELKFAFQNTWADNANAISTQYAGTAALKVDFTRTGKRSIAGMLADGYNSVLRYVLNNFKDGAKQDAFNLFLGVYRVDAAAPSPFAADTARATILTFFLALFVLLSITGFTKVVTYSPYVAAGYWCSFIGIYAAGVALFGRKLVNIPVLTRPHKID